MYLSLNVELFSTIDDALSAYISLQGVTDRQDQPLCLMLLDGGQMVERSPFVVPTGQNKRSKQAATMQLVAVSNNDSILMFTNRTNSMKLTKQVKVVAYNTSNSNNNNQLNNNGL